MCPKTNRQLEEIRDMKRRQIPEAAVEYFANTWYYAISIHELAIQAGISKGLLYHYFSRKNDLLQFIFREIMTIMKDLFDPEDSGKMDEKLLGSSFENLIRHMNSNLLIWKMYMAIFSQPEARQILKIIPWIT